MRGQTTTRGRLRPARSRARGARVVATLASALSALAGPVAGAVGTQAGSPIDNTASVTWNVGATSLSADSNTVTVTVAEVIDLAVVVQSPQLSVDAGATDQAITFSLTNTGNGSEAFALSVDNAVAGDDFDPVSSATAIYLDSDGSGDLTAGDVAYAPGSNDPVLAADESLLIFVLNDIPAGLANGLIGRSRLIATSLTGTGAPGTVFAGLGDGGVDALIGNSSGTANDTGEYIVSAVDLAIVKSAMVLDPFGGSEPVPGAEIRYRIEVTASGTGTASASALSDPIPANTTYVPASITLNGTALTDAADADAGQFTTPALTVDVVLGDLTAASGTQVIEFTVLID